MGCAVVKRHVSIDTNFPKIHSRMQQAKYYNKLDNKLRVLNLKSSLRPIIEVKSILEGSSSQIFFE